MRPAAPAGEDRVPAFPVLRAVITPYGQVTLNGRPVPTPTSGDPREALDRAAAAIAGDLHRPVRVDLTGPGGHVRHLIAQPPDHPEPPQHLEALGQLEPPHHRERRHHVEPPQTRRPPSPPDMSQLPGGPVTETVTAPSDRTLHHAEPPPDPGHRLRRAGSEPAQPGPARPGPSAAALDSAGLLPRLRPATSRPTTGWRARVHRLTRGRLSPAPSVAERRHRDLVATVQQPLDGPRLIAVINPKGGAGKTPATLAVAATFGAHRGAAIAWDNNETRGTLGMRALADPRGVSVWGLLADLTRFETAAARFGDLAAHTRPQGDARFDVLASDAEPTRMEQIGEQEFTRVRHVLARFYALTIVDTGNNVRAPNWQAAVDAADQLLLVTTYSRDAAVTASWTLDHLHATGRGRLADRAVTVLSAATPNTDPRTRDELRDHFIARTRAVIEIPYDPVIADGEHLDLAALRPATREAWLAATSAVTAGLTQ